MPNMPERSEEARQDYNQFPFRESQISSLAMEGIKKDPKTSRYPEGRT
jgi:hypothetical protein